MSAADRQEPVPNGGDISDQPATEASVGAAPTPASDATEIARLSALPLLDYLRERKPAAKRLGCPVALLDRAVDAARNTGGAPEAKPVVGDTGGPGRPLEFPQIEPWPISVDGAVVLDELATAILAYVIVSPPQAYAIALWIVHTHAFESADTTPKLVATSAVMRSGKSRVAEILERTVAQPYLIAGGTTSAAVFRIIEMYEPTLLIDEMDALMASNPQLREALRGLINSSFSRAGARHVTNVPVPGGGWEPREFSTWAPQFLSGIGNLPSTIRDRSIEIVMQRKLPNEKVKRLRRNDGEDLQVLARKAARWAQDNLKALQEARPEVPAGLNDRAADAWEPLFAIADWAGGAWPERARQTALALAPTSTDEIGVTLLGDLRELFGAEPSGVLFTREILLRLCEREDRPYSELQRGRAMTPTQLASMLKPFGIPANKTVRRGKLTDKGYRAKDMEAAWARYLPAP